MAGLLRSARAGKLPTVHADPTLDVTVVLPVFNEAGHLDTELDRITAAMGASPYDYEIVVVDDGSTDGGADRACP